MGCTQDLSRRAATAYVIGKALLVGCAADTPASSSIRSANLVPGLADAGEALTASLGVTTLTRSGTGRAVGVCDRKIAAVANKLDHARGRVYRTT